MGYVFCRIMVIQKMAIRWMLYENMIVMFAVDRLLADGAVCC